MLKEGVVLIGIWIKTSAGFSGLSGKILPPKNTTVIVRLLKNQVVHMSRCHEARFGSRS